MSVESEKINHENPERPYLYETYELNDVFERFFGVRYQQFPEDTSELYAIFQGQTFTETEFVLAQSERFRMRVGEIAQDSPESAVTLLYMAILKKEPDEGSALYTGQLQEGRGPNEIIDELLTSEEYQNNTLAQMYREVFGRDIDSDGRAVYGDKLRSGESLRSIAQELKLSGEHERIGRENEDNILFNGRPVRFVVADVISQERERLSEQVGKLEQQARMLEEQLIQERAEKEGAQATLSARDQMFIGMNDLYSQTVEQIASMQKRQQEAEVRFQALLEEAHQREVNQLKVIDDVTKRNRELHQERTRLYDDIAGDHKRYQKLRTDFDELQRNAGMGGFGENSSLRSENTRLRSENRDLQREVTALEAQLRMGGGGSRAQTEENRRLREEIDRLRAQQAQRQAPPRTEQKPSTDSVDIFLQVCGYDKNSIASLTREEREKVIPKMRRSVGRMWHPEGGGFPNQAAISKVNSFLDQYDPKNNR